MRLSFLGLFILVAVIGASVGGAYGAGFVAGKAAAPAAAAPPAQAAQTPAGASDLAEAMRSGRAGMAGAGGAAGAAGGRGVLGTVEKLEGSTLTVAAAAGGSTQVTLAESTSIQKTADASREELRPGTRVMIVGQQGSGDSMQASSIQIVTAEGASPTGAAPGQLQRSRPPSTPASAP